MRPSALLFAAAVAVPACALAAPVSITLHGPGGRPLAGAVIKVSSPRQPPAASRLSGPFVVAQRNIAFEPHVLVVPVGASVSFPNFDRVRHHVYSFSPTHPFELRLYGREGTRSVVFDRPGVVALGCNIHDSMSGFIVVVDTPYAAITDAAGRVSFADVPNGPVTVTAWHPSIRASANQTSQTVTVAPQGLTTTFTIRR